MGNPRAALSIRGLVIGLAVALTGEGCDRAPNAGPVDAKPPPSSPAPRPASAQPTPSGSQSGPATPPPDAGTPFAVSTASGVQGIVDIEATILDEPQIGRPGPGVVPVANDPRYRLRIRVDRVAPEGTAEFPVGQPVVLGIHSPSRTFPGGVGKEQRVRLQIHWRAAPGKPRSYYHVQRARSAETK